MKRIIFAAMVGMLFSGPAWSGAKDLQSLPSTVLMKLCVGEKHQKTLCNAYIQGFLDYQAAHWYNQQKEDTKDLLSCLSGRMTQGKARKLFLEETLKHPTGLLPMIPAGSLIYMGMMKKRPCKK